MEAAAALVDRLAGLGFEMSLGENNCLIVRPASSLTDELRQSIRDHRANLLAMLTDPDPRVTCRRCANHRPTTYRCTNHRKAGLMTAEIGSDFAAMLQHCPGYAAA